MEEKRKKITAKQLMLVLPVFVVALLAGAFHALGGGASSLGSTQIVDAAKGINTSLPDAQFAGLEPADKMAYYDRAVRDSAQQESKALEMSAEKLGFQQPEDPMVLQVNDKLAAINKEINQPYVPPKVYDASESSVKVRSEADPGMAKDVAKLEALMENMQQGPGETDPEMAQLNQMMDKLIAVQNPKLMSASSELQEVLIRSDTLFAAIPAEVASTQKARQGSVVELRLLDTVILNGVRLPKGHLIYGLAGFSNQRLNLEIKNIRLGNQVLPVSLTVYDKRDAMVGINAPEALLSEAIGSGANNAMGSVGVSGFDLSTQIAGAGIDAARSLLVKKVKRVKQNLKAGYALLLRDNSKKNP